MLHLVPNWLNSQFNSLNCTNLLFFFSFYFFHSIDRIVRVRETRITQIISHILIGLSIFLVPYPLAYIPTAVLDGLFLYMAITSLSGNQMFERITLLFMEQVMYKQWQSKFQKLQIQIKSLFNHLPCAVTTWTSTSLDFSFPLCSALFLFFLFSSPPSLFPLPLTCPCLSVTQLTNCICYKLLHRLPIHQITTFEGAHSVKSIYLPCVN